ncbi:MAG: hypothetical protein WC215_04285 [Bacilli bacterium]|jgi:hypothetical protein
MLESGYIRLYRSLLSWEWYTDTNTKAVFLHLILTANWEPKKWRGITIERGQRVYSRTSLSRELKMSERSIRTSLNHLISTGEVTNQTTPQYSIVTIKNYELYQQATSETTNDRPAGQNEAETPMNTGEGSDNFQNQHNKNSENSTSETTSETTSDNPHKCLADSEIGAANRPTKRPTTDQPPTSHRPQLKNDKNDNKDNKDTPPAPRPAKHKYGEYKNVLLSDSDIEKLKAKFSDWQDRIETLSKGIELKGYKYKNHYLAILKWAERDSSKKSTSKESELTFDIDEYERATNPLYEK